jgi:hypothetical protein
MEKLSLRLSDAHLGTLFLAGVFERHRDLDELLIVLNAEAEELSQAKMLDVRAAILKAIEFCEAVEAARPVMYPESEDIPEFMVTGDGESRPGSEMYPITLIWREFNRQLNALDTFRVVMPIFRKGFPLAEVPNNLFVEALYSAIRKGTLSKLKLCSMCGEKHFIMERGRKYCSKKCTDRAAAASAPVESRKTRLKAQRASYKKNRRKDKPYRPRPHKRKYAD